MNALHPLGLILYPPNMEDDATQDIQTCEQCLRFKGRQYKETLYLLIAMYSLELVLSALTHIMQICHDFDVTNLQQYHNDNTLPHIVHFRSKIQETLCKSREAVTVFLQNQRGDCFFYYHMQL